MWKHKIQQAEAEVDEIHVLIQHSNGISAHIHKAEHAFIDGPYGGLPELLSADKLILVSNGIGIASHLAIVKYIVELPLNQCVPRRVDLVWYAQDVDKRSKAVPRSESAVRDTQQDSSLVRSYLQALIDIDTRQLLCIHTHDHVAEDITARDKSPARQAPGFDPALKTHKRIRHDFTVKEFLEEVHIKEWQRAEAGRTALLGMQKYSELPV